MLASPPLEGWPLSSKIFRGRSGFACAAAHQCASRGFRPRVAPPPAQSASCQMINLHGNLLSYCRECAGFSWRTKVNQGKVRKKSGSGAPGRTARQGCRLRLPPLDPRANWVRGGCDDAESWSIKVNQGEPFQSGERRPERGESGFGRAGRRGRRECRGLVIASGGFGRRLWRNGDNQGKSNQLRAIEGYPLPGKFERFNEESRKAGKSCGIKRGLDESQGIKVNQSESR
jgi:hypothetical protein